MNGHRVIALALLVASLFVLGTFSASLSATVTSTPDDVIDVDTDALPFAGEGADEIADSYRESDEGDRGADDKQAEEGPESGSAASSGDDGSAEGSSDDSGATSSGGSDGDQAEGASGESNQGSSGGSDSGQEDGSGSGQGPGSGSGSLWGLLAQYAVLLLAVLALLGLALLGRVLARRREQLLARLRALADRLGLLPTEERADDVAVPDGEGEVETVVERAWGEMVRTSGVTAPPSATPRECARRVIAAGADPEPVEELTALYEEVRYGPGTVTADDASRALERAREITPGDGASIDTGGPDDDSPATETASDVREGHA